MSVDFIWTDSSGVAWERSFSMSAPPQVGEVVVFESVGSQPTQTLVVLRRAFHCIGAGTTNPRTVVKLYCMEVA